MGDQIELPSPLEQAGDREGIQVLFLGAQETFSSGTPLAVTMACCHCGTWLDALAIRPNSSIITLAPVCIISQV